jgi:3-dehydroquinate dehydratase/shikimate dehydrogenase
MPKRLTHAKRGEADAFKLAVQARTLTDSLRVLRLARESQDVVAVPMGEVGLPARLLALREGSALAYAPVTAATAPGQVSLHDFKKLYRADAATRKTVICGVIGNPIAHSLSPLLHNAVFGGEPEGVCQDDSGIRLARHQRHDSAQAILLEVSG